jgi:creatinine amidohydrolase
VPGGDPHAGATETSLVLALRPDLVALDAAVAGPVPPLADLIAHGVRAVSPSGVLGDPAGATADAGERLLAALVDDLAAAVAAEWPP